MASNRRQLATAAGAFAALTSVALALPSTAGGALPEGMATRAQQCIDDDTALIASLSGQTGADSLLADAQAELALCRARLKLAGTPTPGPTTTSPTLPATTAPAPSPSVTVPTTAPPTPSPSASTTADFPSAANTGVPVGTTLVQSGGLTISIAGTVIDGRDINGCVTVGAANVVIRRSRITCAGSFGIRSNGTGLTIADVEVATANPNGTAVAGANFTATRLNVHGGENGFSLDGNATIVDSYVHDLTFANGGHVDGVQVWQGATGIVLRHNTILNPIDQTSAITADTAGPGLVVDSNLLGGGGYTLYCPQSGALSVVNNTWTKRLAPAPTYGPWVYCDGRAGVSGNKWEDGKPL